MGDKDIDTDGHVRVVGDGDHAPCHQTTGWITPLPGGVGPVTASILMRNSALAARRLEGQYEARQRRRL